MITHNRKNSKIVLVDNLIVSSMNMKRKYSRIKNFASVFRPLYYLSRVWGLASFSILTKLNGELQNPKIHLHDGLWISATITLYSLFAYNTLKTFVPSEENVNEKTFVMMVSARLMDLFGFIYGIWGIMWNLRHRFKFINMVNMFTRFDREVLAYAYFSEGQISAKRPKNLAQKPKKTKRIHIESKQN